MSAQYASGQEDDAPELTNSPGRRLRVARQARGLTLDRVAAELHLSTSTIESLEHDDYDALPGQVFIVGYIRNYARVVGLDVEPLLAEYHNAVPQTGRTWLRPRAKPRNAGQVGSGHLVVRLVSIAILILLCGLAFVWWQNQPPDEQLETADGGAEQETAETAMPELKQEQQTPLLIESGEQAAPAAPQQTAGPPQKPEPEPPVEAAAEQQPPTEVTATAPNTSDANHEPDATADATDKDTGEAEAAAGPGEILMTFDGPCWVDVRDSERNYKLFGEMKKGDRHVLGGKAPYSVILGNAAAVQITVNGATFDLSAVSQGNVARFTLDPGETP